MEETKWNKKFNKIVAPEMGNDIENMDQRNNDDISRMEQKIRKVNNIRRGFSSLPALDSIYTPDDTMEPSNFNAVDPVVEGTLIEGLKGKKKSSKKSSAKKKETAKKKEPAKKKSAKKMEPTFIQNLKSIFDIENTIKRLLGITKTAPVKKKKKEAFEDKDEDEGFESEDEDEGFEDEDEGFEDEDKEGFKKNSKAKKTGLEQLADIGNAVEITGKHIINLLYIPLGIWITFNLYNLLAPLPVPNDISEENESPLKLFQLIFPIFFIFGKLRNIFDWIQNRVKPLVDPKDYRPTVFIVLLTFVYICLYYFQILPVFSGIISKTLDDLDKMINKKAFDEAKAEGKKTFDKVKAEGKKTFDKVKAEAKKGLKSLGFISDKDITVIITILTVIGVVATTAISNPIIGLIATFLYIGIALTLKPILMLGFSLIAIVGLTMNVFLFPYPSLFNVDAIYEHIIEGTSEDTWPKWSRQIITSILNSWYPLLVISGMSIYAIVDIFRHMNATYRNAAIGIFSAPIVFTVGVIVYKVALRSDQQEVNEPSVEPSAVEMNDVKTV